MKPRGYLNRRLSLLHTVWALAQLTLFLTGNQHRRKHLFLRIVQCLPAPKIIDARPGRHRPDIVELPHNSSHTPSPETSEMLRAIADTFSLQKLGSVNQAVKILRIQIALCQILHNLAVCRRISLMHLHNT